MRQAITTKYLGPTNHQESRVKAYCQARPLGVTVLWDYALSAEDNHRKAALALVESMGWDEWDAPGTWHQGALPSCKGYAFVWTP